MATVNLLQGGIRGTIGAETGVRKNGKNILKKRIWSKEPGNETQTKSVRSFECLNRISSSIAKKYWYWLGIRQGNMHKHNAVASEFKMCVRDHVFNPSRLSEIIPPGNQISVNQFSVDPLTGEIVVDVFANLPGMARGTQRALVMVFDGEGHVHLCEELKSPTFYTTFQTQLLLKFPYYLMCFSSTRDGKKITLQNFTLERTLPHNVFYTENFPNVRWWTEEPDRLCGEGAGISTSGQTLVVDGTI